MQRQNGSLCRFSAHRAAALLLVASFALTACGGSDTTSVRGFSGGAAEAEVRIAARPPLSLPPDFSRRPDRAGVDRAPEPRAPRQAGGMVAASGTEAGATSAGQSALLSAAGPAAPADIRARVNEDVQIDMTARALTDQIMSWQRPADQPRLIDTKSSGGLLSRIF